LCDLPSIASWFEESAGRKGSNEILRIDYRNWLRLQRVAAKMVARRGELLGAVLVAAFLLIDVSQRPQQARQSCFC